MHEPKLKLIESIFITDTAACLDVLDASIVDFVAVDAAVASSAVVEDSSYPCPSGHTVVASAAGAFVGQLVAFGVDLG